MRKDLHTGIDVRQIINPQAIGTTGSGGGKTSGVIDRQGFEQVEFVINAGASASVADTINFVPTESDATNTGFASVAAADIIGNKTAITLTAAKLKRFGYKGNKRYLKLQAYGLGTATAIISAIAILGKPALSPVAT